MGYLGKRREDNIDRNGGALRRCMHAFRGDGVVNVAVRMSCRHLSYRARKVMCGGPF